MGKRRKVDVTTSAEPVVGHDGMVILHRARFIEWQPSAVVALTTSDDGSLTVAARENGDIELYEAATFQLLRRIPGHVDASPTSVALVTSDEGSAEGCRLFTAGLDGTIIEYDLESCCPETITDGNGGAIWNLAFAPNLNLEPNSKSNSKSNSKFESEYKHENEHGPQTIPNGVGHGTAPQQHDDNEDSSSEEGEDDIQRNDSSLPSNILAAACDDGSVRLFTVEYGLPGVVYLKSLPRVEGRTLAVAWHPTAEFLVSGGTDGCIHVWQVATGREMLRINVGDGTGREVSIWSLLVLPDGTIVSGDSVGNVCFWDGRFGTLISKFDRHAADVLALAASPDGTMVFAAGVDPQIGVFKKLQGGAAGSNSQSWAFLSAKRTHTHDIRAMCIAHHGGHGGVSESMVGMGCQLFTGSNDTQIFAHSVDRFLKQHPSPVNSCPQLPLFDTGMLTKPWLLVANRNEVDIWKLGSPAQRSSQSREEVVVEGALVPPRAVQQHLVHLVNRNGDFINAIACSSGGEYVAFADTKSLRCLKISVEDLQSGGGEEKVSVSTVALQPSNNVSNTNKGSLKGSLPPAAFLTFRPGHPSVLIAVAPDGLVRIVDTRDPQKQSTIRDLHDLRFKMWYKRDRSRSQARRLAPAITLCKVSPFDGKWLAAVVRNRIYLLDLDTNKISSQILFSGGSSEQRGTSNTAANMPHANEQVASIAFSKWNGTQVLLVCTTRNHVSMYDCATGQPTAWTLKHPADSMPSRLVNFPGPIIGIVPIPRDEDDATVVLYSNHAMCHIDFSVPLSNEPSAGRELTAMERRAKPRREYQEKQREEFQDLEPPTGENCRIVRNLNPILHVAKLGDGELLVVERSWAEVMANIAAPLYRHRFGT